MKNERRAEIVGWLRRGFPRLGKPGRDFSRAWKFFRKISPPLAGQVQCLEKTVVPISNPWKLRGFSPLWAGLSSPAFVRGSAWVRGAGKPRPQEPDAGSESRPTASMASDFVGRVSDPANIEHRSEEDDEL
jgi:hypothetical protein